MSWISKIFSNDSEYELTPAQKHMYVTETINNFRTMAKLFSTRSSYTLTSRDLVSPDVYAELAELSQFAVIAYCEPEIEFLFANLSMLMQPDFPFEGFTALPDTVPVSAFLGRAANVPGVVVYRKRTKQLVVAFSGTANFHQTLYDLYSVKQAHPIAQGCSVHSGFWKMYQGCQEQVLRCVKKGLDKHDVRELVSVGHSMGAVLANLFALDVLSGRLPLSSGMTMTVAAFGCPRFGDAALFEYWQDLVRSHRALNGEGSVKEYQVKALNDGIPSLPPPSWGYRSISEAPLYLHHGRLFKIPASESEHGVFTVAQDALDTTRSPDHPRGGHNYYGRDVEKVVRRIYWMEKLSKDKSDWKEAYLAKIGELERAWQKNGHVAEAGSTGSR